MFAVGEQVDEFVGGRQVDAGQVRGHAKRCDAVVFVKPNFYVVVAFESAKSHGFCLGSEVGCRGIGLGLMLTCWLVEGNDFL